MRVLIINQHGANRGDHAAFITQIDFLKSYFPRLKEIDVVYNSTMLPYEIHSEGVSINHHPEEVHGTFMKVMFRLVCIFPIISYFLADPYSNKLKKLFRNADLVILANGGANLGPYRDWRYLYRLILARLSCDQKTLTFGNSFQPSGNRVFDKCAIREVKHFGKYLLRDEKSQEYAKENDVDFHATFDVVFYHSENLFQSRSSGVSGSYVVFVPNELYKWHPDFEDAKDDLTDLYITLLNLLTGRGYKVVMLPQLFGDNHISDYHFFLDLKSNSKHGENVIVIDDQMHPSQQIDIIKEAEFVIGGRYHSLVFGICSHTPALSLSYEHKMEGMMTALDLGDYNYRISSLFSDNIEGILSSFVSNLSSAKEAVVRADAHAKQRVRSGLETLNKM